LILEIKISGKTHHVNLSSKNGSLQVFIDGEEIEGVDASFPEPGLIQFLFGGNSYEFRVSEHDGELTLDRNGSKQSVQVRDPRALRSRRAGGAGDAGPMKITAPMPGKVVRVIAPEGTELEAGAGVIVIEAMKMQNELKSPKTGRVQKIAVAEGATVNPGDTLAVIS
jgi:biotin carboxyl carrier protein